jgi:hypothetical protein
MPNSCNSMDYAIFYGIFRKMHLPLPYTKSSRISGKRSHFYHSSLILCAVYHEVLIFTTYDISTGKEVY